MKIKLTDKDGYTRRDERNETLWEVGKTHEIDKAHTGKVLCSADVFHFYDDLYLGVLLNPIHAEFDPATMRAFEVKGRACVREGQLKGGAKKLTVIRELEVPQFTTEQRIAFGISCALKVCSEPNFVRWANNWLDGTDRSPWAAEAAEAARAAEAAWAARAAQEAKIDGEIDLITLARKAYNFERDV